jgi:drug/metabolite transporter (DMT)-like permease
MWVGSVEEVGEQLVGAFQNPGLLLGIPLALAGAVFMSFGAQDQHRGVEKVERLSGQDGASGLTMRQLSRLLSRPSWVVGTLMLGMAILCQLGALTVAPLIVVQPLGAIALVVTTLLNSRVSGLPPTRRSLMAIIACVGGIFIFVIIAAIFATERPLSQNELITVLVTLAIVMVAMLVFWIVLRKRMRALFYILSAGVVYGFVATLAKVVIKRIQAGEFEWLTLVCLIALLAATGVGAYFVQTAYSSGPPDLVIAGLTVIDPMVAVLIGLLVLGEGGAAPLWALIGFGIAGAIAVWGVITLARFHPQVLSNSQELPILRGGSRGADSSGLTATDDGAGPHPLV